MRPHVHRDGMRTSSFWRQGRRAAPGLVKGAEVVHTCSLQGVYAQRGPGRSVDKGVGASVPGARKTEAHGVRAALPVRTMNEARVARGTCVWADMAYRVGFPRE
jgi:hypothetical protein